MENYFCNCLNVIIHVNDSETREVDGQDFLPDEVKGPQGKNVDPFFDDKLLDVNLAISGIEMVQSTNILK